jgi:hypothetical protein
MASPRHRIFFIALLFVLIQKVTKKSRLTFSSLEFLKPRCRSVSQAVRLAGSTPGSLYFIGFALLMVVCVMQRCFEIATRWK